MSRKNKLSERQLAANRRNAQKSTGPTSCEGKRVSRANAVKHALTSMVCILSTESEKEFDDLADSYVEEFNPVSRFEAHLLADIIAVHWNMRRIRFIETGIYEVEYQKPDLVKNYSNVEAGAKTILAYVRLSATNLLTMADRQLNRLNREYTRLMKLFTDFRRDNPPSTQPSAQSSIDQSEKPEIQETQNEPIPATGQANEPQTSIRSFTRNLFKLMLLDQEDTAIAPGAAPPLTMIA